MSDEIVLIEWRIQPPRGAGSGTRVLADGPCQHWSATALGVDSSQRANVTSQDPAWRTAYRYTAEEMAEVRTAIARAAAAGLHARYPAPRPVHDAGPLVVRFGAEFGSREVIVEGHPVNSVPEIVELQRRLGEIHQWPKETSRWRVKRGAGIVERTMSCSVIQSERLQAVTRALYDDSVLSAPGEGAAFMPAGTPLLEIEWFEDGRAAGRTRFYGDGNLTEIEDSTELLRRRLTQQGVHGVEQALADLDLASLPDPASPP
ncbi:MAG TPA: hypothetical protein VHT91_30515 [Kofleriaceae bacterium]|jgi:hypothetical protein|nr:hypothetical protein [Kofleriaceae bacterium]